MKKVFLSIFVLLLLCLPQMGIAQEKSYEPDQRYVIFFVSDSCAPCQKMKKETLEECKDQLREMYDGFFVININDEKNESIVKENNITAVPIIKVYKIDENKMFKPLAFMKGYKDRDGLLRFLKKFSEEKKIVVK